jgi:outer membrane protein, adhesin transport system
MLQSLAAKRPFRRALSFSCAALLLVGTAFGDAFAANDGVSPAPTGAGSVPDGLRVHAVADGMIGFLGQATQWIDLPASRLPIASLRPAVQQAVSGHPDVRLAQEQQATAGFASREAFAGFLPQVSTTFDGGQRHFDRVQTPISTVPEYDKKTKAIGINARQLLYDFGGVRSRVDAQSSREVAAEAKAQTRRSELTLRAVTAWHDVFRARQQLNLAVVNRNSRQQILNFIEERETLGGSSKSDVLRVKARLSDAQAALVFAESRLSVAEASYLEVFNAPPPKDLRLPEAPNIDLGRFAGAKSVSTTAEQSSLIKEAQAQSTAAARDADSAAAAMLPSMFLEVSATRRDIGGGTGTVPGVDTAALIVFQHNFYSGGAELARKRQADQRAVETRLEEESLKRQVERAISQSVAEARNSDAIMSTRKETVKVAAVAFEAVREQFAFRRGTLLDLLRAQEELFLAGRDMIDGVVDHALSRHRLLHLAMELAPLFGVAATANIRE